MTHRRRDADRKPGPTHDVIGAACLSLDDVLDDVDYRAHGRIAFDLPLELDGACLFVLSCRLPASTPLPCGLLTSSPGRRRVVVFALSPAVFRSAAVV